MIKASLFLRHRLSIASRYEPMLSEIQVSARQEIISKIENNFYTYVSNPCPICRDTPADLGVGEIDRYKLPVRTVICKRCSLMRTDPIMEEGAYIDFYQHYYRRLYTGSVAATEDFFWDQFRRGEKLHKFLSSFIDLKGQTVLEVGVGAGGILSALCKNGATGLGCDYGEEYLSFAIAKGLDVRAGGLSQFDSSSADVVVYSHVLEHIVDLAKELKEIHRVLKPNGFLLINVPGVFNLHRDYAGDLLQYLQNAHLFHFSKHSLRLLLLNNGFKQVEATEKIFALFTPSELNSIENIPVNNRWILLWVYLQICNVLRPFLSIPHYLWKFASKFRTRRGNLTQ